MFYDAKRIAFNPFRNKLNYTPTTCSVICLDVDLNTELIHNKNMIKFNKTPVAAYDKELAAKGLKRILVSEYVETSNKDLGGGVCYREKVVPIVSEALPEPFLKMKKGRARMNVDNSVMVDVEAAVNKMVRESRAKKSDKAPREGSKLAQAVELIKQTGKDDKESCLLALIFNLGVKRGNATIYYAKAKEILG